MEMIAIDIADGFPVTLLCLSDATVMLNTVGEFPLIVEDIPKGVSSIFQSEHFSLREEGQEDYQIYCYNFPYKYKEMPALKAWLVQQKLVSPIPMNADSTTEGEYYESY